MKICIDENVCQEKGVRVEIILLLSLIKTGVNIKELLEELEEQHIIFPHQINGNYLIPQKWDDICCNVLLASDKSVPEESYIEGITKELMEIFPKGKKEGTSAYWRGNLKDNTLRMKKFFKLYGNKFTKEDIINAATNYVQSFNGQYGYMRVLKYFIWKDVRKIDSDGNGYVESVSDLATYIENEGQEDINNAWLNELK